MTSFYHTFNRAAHGLYETLKGPASSYCRLVGAEDSFTLVSDDSSLISALEVHGTLEKVSEEGRKKIVSTLAEKLRVLFDGKGRFLKIVFSYDPKVPSSYENNETSAIRRAGAIGLSGMEGILEDWHKSINALIGAESLRLYLWTTLSNLTGAKHNGKANKNSKTLRDASKELLSSHQGALGALVEALRLVGLVSEKISAKKIIRHIKASIYGEAYAPANWEPRLLGDPFPLVYPQEVAELALGKDLLEEGKGINKLKGQGNRKEPQGDLLSPHWGLFPDIKGQIFSSDCEVVEREFIKAGDLLHAPFFLSIPPRDPKPFSELMRALSQKRPRVPLEIAISLSPDGLGSMKMRTMIARILSFSSQDNRQLVGAYEELAALAEEGLSIVGLSVNCNTMVRLFDYESTAYAVCALKRQKSVLSTIISGWGESSVQEEAGDPLLSLCATTALLPHGGPAPRAAAPLGEVMNFFPIRPASAWTDGPVRFRTPDGKAMAYAPNSSQQAAWIDLGFAPMGAGKSVLLNTLNLAFALSNPDSLGYLSILDVGPSSKGLIELLQSTLPQGKKHLAAFHRLRLTKEYAVNPFDTPLGLRSPLTGHLGFLVNFLTLLATPVGGLPPTGVGGIMRLAIEGAYRDLKLRPRLFTPGNVGPKLYEFALDKGLSKKDSLSVWEAVDFLFGKGYRRQAYLCQRAAVPTLSDAANMLRVDPGIKATYCFKVPGTGEDIKDYAWRCLSEAIRDYPLIAEKTRFSVGDARVIALDLDEVAPRGAGALGDRQTAIMYMLGRYLAAGRFFLMPQDVLEMEPMYRDYHLERINNMRLSPKRLCYDELHRVTGEEAVKSQLIGDLETISRESRKWNLSIGLYSQNLNDFPEVILDLATSVFLMGVGNMKGKEKLEKVYGLNSELANSLESLGKPGPLGAQFVAVFKTRLGTVRQLLCNTLSPALLWAFSSTTEDCALRAQLYARFGVEKSLKALSRLYPSGIKGELERRLLNNIETSKGALGEIFAEVAREIRG
ncbi:MAG: hypothetical protein LBE38_08660 [Deltaproteobacteria bacterium]|jgi:intracellular multiplication protein IcmB|nr:hypothetical protein [Deltaproteobacteria bacterium]